MKNSLEIEFFSFIAFNQAETTWTVSLSQDALKLMVLCVGSSVVIALDKR